MLKFCNICNKELNKGYCTNCEKQVSVEDIKYEYDPQENIPSYEDVMNEHFSDVEKHNRPIFEFLEENESFVFLENLMKYIEEESDIVGVNQKFELLNSVDLVFKKDEDYEDSFDITIACEQTCNGGMSGDSFAGSIYVELPNSKKIFKFDYSC